VHQLLQARVLVAQTVRRAPWCGRRKQLPGINYRVLLRYLLSMSSFATVESLLLVNS
jgi:hypothetical protein